MTVGDFADDASGRAVDLGRQVLGAVICLADAVGVEGVGRQNFRAGLNEPLADGADDVRLCDVE